jgi:hypothetical protein
LVKGVEFGTARDSALIADTETGDTDVASSSFSFNSMPITTMVMDVFTIAPRQVYGAELLLLTFYLPEKESGLKKKKENEGLKR